MNVVRVKKNTGVSPFASNDPEDIAWRCQQMAVDNDIEGVARNPQLEAQILTWDDQGIPVEKQIEMLKAHFASR
jgi:hypothetical protein